MFEAMFSVPPNELLVRAIGATPRYQQPSAIVDDTADAVLIVCLSRHQNLKVSIKPDQSAIKRPVGSPGQRETVADDVRTVCLNGADVRRLHFSSPAAVDQLQTRNCAALVIGAQDNPPENAVTNNPRNERSYSFPRSIKKEGRALFA